MQSFLKGTTTEQVLKPKKKQTALIRPEGAMVIELFGDIRGGYDPYDPYDWMPLQKGEPVLVNILGKKNGFIQCQLVIGGCIAKFPMYGVSVQKVDQNIRVIPVYQVRKNTKR